VQSEKFLNFNSKIELNRKKNINARNININSNISGTFYSRGTGNPNVMQRTGNHNNINNTIRNTNKFNNKFNINSHNNNNKDNLENAFLNSLPQNNSEDEQKRRIAIRDKFIADLKANNNNIDKVLAKERAEMAAKKNMEMLAIYQEKNKYKILYKILINPKKSTANSKKFQQFNKYMVANFGEKADSGLAKLKYKIKVLKKKIYLLNCNKNYKWRMFYFLKQFKKYTIFRFKL
jgi:hypothetical protein